MSQVNTTEFRRVLEAKQNELSFTACQRDDIMIETTADEIDRLQQQLSRDVSIRHLDRTARLLKSVQAALDRIEDGIYEVCLRCEEPIREKRLKAVPWASYCIDCQQSIDTCRVSCEDDRKTMKFAAEGFQLRRTLTRK